MRRTVELIATITIEFSETATAADMLEMRERISQAVQPVLFIRGDEKIRRSCGHHYDLHYRDFTHDEE
jgi:hypothetical protein